MLVQLTQIWLARQKSVRNSCVQKARGAKKQKSTSQSKFILGREKVVLFPPTSILCFYVHACLLVCTCVRAHTHVCMHTLMCVNAYVPGFACMHTFVLLTILRIIKFPFQCIKIWSFLKGFK